MATNEDQVLEGIFAVAKPSTITTPQLLLDLQTHFSTSQTFAPLLQLTRQKREEQNAHQPPSQQQKDAEASNRFFKMGHGGTLDPLASGVLIVGIGRGTKYLSTFLGGTKTYETVVLLGKSTDTYDIEGAVTGEIEASHVSKEVVQRSLEQFRGTFKQKPPVYSALKIGGMKAVDYVRAGKELPRELEAREVSVDECALLEFYEAGSHEFKWQSMDATATKAPAVRIRLTVSSGFYVRSFCHDLGVACGSLATMAALVRMKQSGYSLHEECGTSTAIPCENFEAGEEVWGPLVKKELKGWMEQFPVKVVQMNGHGKRSRDHNDGQDATGFLVKQRFRGEWLATTKKERIQQQGGKRKGKYNQPRKQRLDATVPSNPMANAEDGL